MDRQLMLDKAVTGLFLEKHSAFLSTIYCGLKFSWDVAIPTACTNGLNLLINPSWFASLTERSRVALLAHEIWHVALMHMARVGDRDHRAWNWACDHAINLQMLDDGFHFDMPYLGDPQYAGMTAEQIYDLIPKSMPMQLPFGDDIECPPNQEEKELIEQQVTNLIIRAKTVSEMSGQGNLPGEMQAIIDKMLKPKMPWHILLQRWCTEVSSLASTWSKPNRRYPSIYLPSHGGQDGLAHLIFGIDSSGSMSELDLVVINAELAKIKEIHNPKMMEIISFDTQIQDTWEFQAEDKLDRLSIHGRGGTNMQPLFDLVKQKRPTALVMFSDMWCHIPDPVPGVSILWIALNNPSFKASYGHTIHLDTSTYSSA